jgi:hypothetical protein
MQHYSRECERGQTRIAELERWQTNCEAGIAALEACWTQVLTFTIVSISSAAHDPFSYSTRLNPSCGPKMHLASSSTRMVWFALSQSTHHVSHPLRHI